MMDLPFGTDINDAEGLALAARAAAVLPSVVLGALAG